MPKTEELEKQIIELFKSEGIEKCTERFLNTIKTVTKSEDEYKNELIKRLKQGGIDCEI